MRTRTVTAIVAILPAAAFLAATACTSEVADRSAASNAVNANVGQSSAPEEPARSAEERRRLRQQGDSDAGYPWISADDLKARLDRREKLIIVNTRSAVSDPIVAGSIEVSEDDIETWAARIPKSATIVTYCS